MINKENILNTLLIVFGFLIILLLIKINNNNNNDYSSNINSLEFKNKQLLYINDSLNSVNNVLIEDIKNIEIKVDSINIVLSKTELKLKNIKHEKIRIINHINSLHADSVAIYFSNYIDKRK
jgi:hypothetical protein